MIVYADREEWVDAAPELERLRASASSLAAAGSPPHGDVAELLIDFGRLEAGVVDALSPSEDDAPPLARAFREASLALGRALRATWRRDSDDDLPRALSSVTDAFRLLTADGLPERVRLTVPEGYAFYALYPEMYLAAAERFAAEARPEWAVCIGIRSIGTSLSAVVAAALEAAGCRVASYTLRPRGHPFDRRPALADALAAELRGQSDAWFLVVDEGPGLSGSSFCGTAEALSALGVPDERIVLFPSWVPDGGGFRSPAARERWGRHRKVAASFEEVWLQSGRLFAGVPHHEVRDWSAGAWRADLIGDETCFPAVQPQHERRKYLLRGGEEATLLKFAGLGARGRKALDRARALAEAGFAPPALGVEDGFLRTRFVPGHPHLSGPVDADLVETAARYLAFRARRFRTGRSAQVSALAEMVCVNVREGLGEEWADRLGFLESLPPKVADAEAVEVDGRMLPHEWVRTAGGWLKTDGVDHHDDHFFPGCQDPAWDVAGFAVETGMEDGAASAFAARCAELAGDGGLAARLPIYRVAYPAYRLGYATMAAESLGDSADGARMAALAQRYAAVLRREIARCAVSGGAGEEAALEDGRPVWLYVFDADNTLRRTVVDGKPCPHAPGEWELLPGVRERLGAIRWGGEGGALLGVASNQDQVAYGHLTAEMAHRLLADAVRAAVGDIHPPPCIRFCPHALEVPCDCRKPGAAMLLDIMRHFGVSPEHTLFVGDAETDREAALAAGVRFAWARDFFGWGGSVSPPAAGVI